MSRTQAAAEVLDPYHLKQAGKPGVNLCRFILILDKEMQLALLLPSPILHRARAQLRLRRDASDYSLCFIFSKWMILTKMSLCDHKLLLYKELCRRDKVRLTSRGFYCFPVTSTNNTAFMST